jgi:alkyl hydroperoxide reductase subunit AhpC
MTKYKSMETRKVATCSSFADHEAEATERFTEGQEIVFQEQTNKYRVNMSMLGNVRIGHKAPDFHCEAVIKGVIEGPYVIYCLNHYLLTDKFTTEVTLSTYINPSIKPGTPNPDAPWLIILFIPAAFSFVCPTEVLAFQNCLDEFKDRQCSVVFISVDTKHSLWHWQNVPRQYGGLGMTDIPLLSDATHRISRDYGVLIEDEGVSLRGMFIIDGEGIVQQVSIATFLPAFPYSERGPVLTADNTQITLNNLTVGRSVLEALRLLEAFQAVAKHGVLCPIDWKPSGDAADTLNTISNTLTESYDERLANLQKEFEDVPVTDLDAKHASEDNSKEGSIDGDTQPTEDTTPKAPVRQRSHSSPQRSTIVEVSCQRPKQPGSPHSHPNDCLPHPPSPPPQPSHSNSFNFARSSSAPHSTSGTPIHTPNPPAPARQIPSTARHARGMPPHGYIFCSSSAPSMFSSLMRRISQSTSDTDSDHTSCTD